MSLLRSGVDTYVLYSLIRRLSTPFTEWKAYKLGVIDDKGNIMVKPSDRTSEQKGALTYFDIFAMNLRKMMAKVPGGNSKLTTYAAALWLIKEDNYIMLNSLNEEGEGAVPANTSSGGHLARSSEKEAKSLKIGKDVMKRLRPKSLM